MKGFNWCDFEWDPDVFPDPEGMLKRYHEKGLKLCCWINPYIGQASPLFEEGMEKGYLLKKTNGDVWQTDMWQAGMAIVDVTNPDAREWYSSYLRKLLAMGIDCFKTDFGERIPVRDIAYFDGSEGTNEPFEYHIPNAQLRVYKKLKPEPLFSECAAKSHFSWHMMSGGNAFDVFPCDTFKELILECAP